jgi:hypothetical protein
MTVVKEVGATFVPSLVPTRPCTKIYPPLSPPFRLHEPLYPSSIPEIQALVQKLVSIDRVVPVRAIAPKSGDRHWIEFEMELPLGVELPDDVWAKVQDLVIDYEWKLRDETKEKWYFHARIVEAFSRLDHEGRVISTSYLQSLERHPKISESHIKFIV